MKYLRVGIAIGICTALIAGSNLVASRDDQQGGERGFSGGSYLTSIRDASGDFASRSVITLHADRTMSAIDSGQGGPTFFFSSQRGSWRPNGARRVGARMVDFPFPPSSPGVARADYTIEIAPDGRKIVGTITVTVFPLQHTNFIDGQGTLIGTFTFVGELITP